LARQFPALKYIIDSIWEALNVSSAITLKETPGAASSRTLLETQKAVIEKIRMPNMPEGIKPIYISLIEDAENFEGIYYVLAAFMADKRFELSKENELELILEQRRLKTSIFADALNKSKVTVERIEQPKFKHYRDTYPRFVAHLGGIELHLILRTHILRIHKNVDIKNKAYEYSLNVYEESKGGFQGDLYFKSEVSFEGGVIVTSMSEKILGASLEDLNILAEKISEILGDSTVSSALTQASAPNDIGAVDFRTMNIITQPMGSFSGLNFSPVAMSSSSLEGLDLDKELEGIKRMASSGIVPSPSRNKEYVSACILKGRLEDKADEFVLTMQDVFQLQAEEGIESAAEEREALVMADTRSYVLPRESA